MSNGKRRHTGGGAEAVARALARSLHDGTELGRYAAICLDCGRKGLCIESLNEWGGINTSWIGFRTILPRSKRLMDDPDAMEPRCFCGSSKVVAGLGDY